MRPHRKSDEQPVLAFRCTNNKRRSQLQHQHAMFFADACTSKQPTWLDAPVPTVSQSQQPSTGISVCVSMMHGGTSSAANSSYLRTSHQCESPRAVMTSGISWGFNPCFILTSALRLSSSFVGSTIFLGLSRRRLAMPPIVGRRGDPSHANSTNGFSTARSIPSALTGPEPSPNRKAPT